MLMFQDIKDVSTYALKQEIRRRKRAWGVKANGFTYKFDPRALTVDGSDGHAGANTQMTRIVRGLERTAVEHRVERTQFEYAGRLLLAIADEMCGRGHRSLGHLYAPEQR